MIICSLDMGKHIGLAKYDKEIDIIFPVGVFNFEQIINKLNLIKPDFLVFGLPLSLNNQENLQCVKIRSQSETLLKKLVKTPQVFFFDERFSSKFTHFHDLSAVWILENFLKKNIFNNN